MREDEVITVTVNGIVESIDTPKDVPLMWVLREELGLTGTKFGCGSQSVVHVPFTWMVGLEGLA